MNKEQWIREYELTLGKGGGEGFKTSDLRIAFSIQKGDTESPNPAVIKIWNLSDNTLQQVKREFDRVILKAGYKDNPGLIFDGNIIGIRIIRENVVDKILEVTCGDGDKAYTTAHINKTLKAGAKPSDVLNEVQGSFAEYDVEEGYIAEFEDEQSLPRGKVMFGMARSYAREVAYTTDTSWSIQDGRLTVVEHDGYLPGEAVVLNSSTGLVGAPEQTNDGINVRCLLNPRIKINSRIKIDNSSIVEAQASAKKSDKDKKPAELNSDGFYRVIQITYSGDTHGQDWYCDMVCVSIDASGSKTVDRRGASG